MTILSRKSPAKSSLSAPKYSFRVHPFFISVVGLTSSMLSISAHAHDLSCPVGHDYTLAIHGGAGVILKENMSETEEKSYRESLENVLAIGASSLKHGASALDTVVTVITKLENDPKFNAGKGAVFSAAGKNELDASIMDGRDRNAGAVAGVTTVKNPIKLARSVMEKSPHVMLQAEGAEDFARLHDLEIVEPEYFHTDRRWKQLLKKRAAQKIKKKTDIDTPETKYGTVGAVIRDNCGNLAAGTSTGGLTAKQFGRIGDTPIIGAGTYADNRYCAVSATGTGEFFIRGTIARDVCARREFGNETLSEATNAVIHGTLTEMNGTGGIIAIDNEGNYNFSFNTEGMYRGAVRNGKMHVEIFKTK